jgi:hypothetical protein
MIKMVVVLLNPNIQKWFMLVQKYAFQVSCGGCEYCLKNFEGVVLVFMDRLWVCVV